MGNLFTGETTSKEASAAPGRTRLWPAAAIGTLLLVAGFLIGVVSSRHAKTTVLETSRSQYLSQKGDASDPDRAGVLRALQEFQDGYSARDHRRLDSFMSDLFPDNDDILLLGTDAREWIRGREPVRQFIRSDWEGWGDFTFDVNHTIVWSSGNVAWIASVGHVRASRSNRPVRFSAVLARDDRSWRFRQIQFQWDEQDPELSDLAHPETMAKLFSWWTRWFQPESATLTVK